MKKEVLRQFYVGTPCPWCGVTMTKWGNGRHSVTRDHIVPLATLNPRKGRNGKQPTVNNRAIVCKTCNENKGAMWIGQWLAKLRKRNDPRAERVAAYTLLLPPEMIMPTRVAPAITGVITCAAEPTADIRPTDTSAAA
jgi:hypothetical protein